MTVINKAELKLEVLNCVSQYYPIGLPFLNRQYAGYSELLKIVEQKVNTLLKNGRIEIWSSLVKQIEINFPENSVQDLAYQQYPNLQLRVILESASDKILERSRIITIYMSLLSPYYTLFFIEDLRPIGVLSKVHAPPVRTVWYSNASCEQETEYLALIDQLIKQYYPKHKFIDHHFLFTMEIFGGIPHGEDLEVEIAQNPSYKYTAFDFLFGLDEHTVNRKLIVYD